jgi:hypothetical protein
MPPSQEAHQAPRPPAKWTSRVKLAEAKCARGSLSRFDIPSVGVPGSCHGYATLVGLASRLFQIWSR